MNVAGSSRRGRSEVNTSSPRNSSRKKICDSLRSKVNLDRAMNLLPKRAMRTVQSSSLSHRRGINSDLHHSLTPKSDLFPPSFLDWRVYRSQNKT